mmetsp:Transcript_9567/g.17010  ORF Transcript_9567/g.17010 Transcript_9567/m.17010 type:complete len:260 (-) Transcript_9567:283-1062(-)
MDLAEAFELVERFDRVERTDASLLGGDFTNRKPSSSWAAAAGFASSRKGDFMGIPICSLSSPTWTEISPVDTAGTAFSSAPGLLVKAVTVELSVGLPSRTVDNCVLMADTFSTFSAVCSFFSSRSSFALVVLDTTSVALESTLRMVRKLSLFLDLEREPFFSSLSVDSSLLLLLPPFLFRSRDLEREERHRLIKLFRPRLSLLSSARIFFFFFFFLRKPPQVASSASDSGSASEASTTASREFSCSSSCSCSLVGSGSS